MHLHVIKQGIFCVTNIRTLIVCQNWQNLAISDAPQCNQERCLKRYQVWASLDNISEQWEPLDTADVSVDESHQGRKYIKII